MADISGTWLGSYWHSGKQTRFEATLIQSGNNLMGNILDDEDEGEATVTGEVISRSVSFLKRYVIPSSASVQYMGTIAKNDNYMQGQWRFDRKHHGNWEARRIGENFSLTAKIQKSEKAPQTVR